MTFVPLPKLLAQSYDSVICCDLYHREVNPDLLFELMSPLAQLVLLDVMKGLSEEEFQEYLADGLAELYQNLRNRKYQTEIRNDDHFTYFFYTALRRQYIRHYHDTKRWLPDTGSEYLTHPRLLSQRDIEHRIFLAELPGEIWHRVECQIRFDGLEYQACLYVLDRLLRHRRVVSRKMKKDFRVSDPDFFRDYVQVLLRNVMYEIKYGA